MVKVVSIYDTVSSSLIKIEKFDLETQTHFFDDCNHVSNDYITCHEKQLRCAL